MSVAPLPPGCSDPGGAADTKTTERELRLNNGIGRQSQALARLRRQRNVERVCKIAPLACEHWAALRSTRFADLSPLAAAGVDWRAIAEAVPAHALIRVTKCAGFEFDAEGKSAFVLPVRSDAPFTPESSDPASVIREGAVVDLLAFHPAWPSYWALRHDAAEWLGAIEPQYLEPEPVPIWRSPLSWLRAGCRGLVLLGDQASRYRILTLLHSITAEDEQHAAELRRVLARPWPTPQVISFGSEVRHAA